MPRYVLLDALRSAIEAAAMIANVGGRVLDYDDMRMVYGPGFGRASTRYKEVRDYITHHAAELMHPDNRGSAFWKHGVPERLFGFNTYYNAEQPPDTIDCVFGDTIITINIPPVNES